MQCSVILHNIALHSAPVGWSTVRSGWPDQTGYPDSAAGRPAFRRRRRESRSML